MNERNIIALFQARDESAIDACRKEYGSYLTALAERILGDKNEAEECVSDTYLQVWQRIPPDDPLYFRGYLAAICRFFAFGRLDKRQAQKRSAEVVALTDELCHCIPDRQAEEIFDLRELGQQLDRFLRSLPKEQRQIFLRRYWFGDSVREVAQRFRIGESKVKTSLFRTREKLRTFLESEGYDV